MTARLLVHTLLLASAHRTFRRKGWRASESILSVRRLGRPGIFQHRVLSIMRGGANQQGTLLIKKLVPQAKIPTRGSAQAAGLDLYSSVNMSISSKGKALVDTGISLQIPEGHYGRIAPRSGLACKRFIDVGAGVIDSDYRGPLKVLLFNFADSEFTVSEGDRIAQLIIEKISFPEIVEVSDLDNSARGDSGFGSTGAK